MDPLAMGTERQPPRSIRRLQARSMAKRRRRRRRHPRRVGCFGVPGPSDGAVGGSRRTTVLNALTGVPLLGYYPKKLGHFLPPEFNSESDKTCRIPTILLEYVQYSPRPSACTARALLLNPSPMRVAICRAAHALLHSRTARRPPVVRTRRDPRAGALQPSSP